MEKVTSEELTERQAWPWKQKVDHSLGVIDQFLSRIEGKAFFSTAFGFGGDFINE